MPSKKFQKKVEDFVCEHCGQNVKGDGYTNHCPFCLWSKHVDVHPGDRAHDCAGMMEPIGVEGGTPNYRLVLRCQKCKHLQHMTVHKGDSPDALVAIAAHTALRAAQGLPPLY